MATDNPDVQAEPAEDIPAGEEAPWIDTPMRKDKDNVFHFQAVRGRALNWQDLPAEFTVEEVRRLRLSDLEKLRDDDGSLTDAQRQSFLRAETSLQRVAAEESRERISRITANLFTPGLRESMDRIIGNLVPKIDISPGLREAIGRQSEALSKIEANTPVYPTIVPKPGDELEATLATAVATEHARDEAILELTSATADSTTKLAELATAQAEENSRLRYVTNLLAFAVLYDVINGTFDDHGILTTIGSAALAAAVLIVAGLAGARRRSAG